MFIFHIQSPCDVPLVQLVDLANHAQSPPSAHVKVVTQDAHNANIEDNYGKRRKRKNEHERMRYREERCGKKERGDETESKTLARKEHVGGRIHAVLDIQPIQPVRKSTRPPFCPLDHPLFSHLQLVFGSYKKGMEKGKEKVTFFAFRG